jgi:WD40 repeat protein
MTFRTEHLRSLLWAAAAVWLAGAAACGADNVIGVDTGKPPSDTPLQYSALSYDASRDQLVVGTNRGVTLFQAADGRKLQSIAVDLINGSSIFLARRAGGVLTASDYQKARIFDDAGNLLRSIALPSEGVSGLDLKPDGTTIAASSFALAPNGTPITTSSLVGRVRLADTATGAATDVSLPLPSDFPAIYHIAFSPDGGYLAAAVPGIRIWHISDGAVWADISGYGDDIAFSAAGEIAVRRGAVDDVFAVPSGAQLASYPTGEHPLGEHPLMAYAADGTRLAVTAPDTPDAGVVDNSIRVIDRVTGAAAVDLVDDPQTRPPENERLGPRHKVALAFAGPDRIAVAWNDGRLAVFSSSDGARVWSRLDSD